MVGEPEIMPYIDARTEVHDVMHKLMYEIDNYATPFQPEIMNPVHTPASVIDTHLL